MKQEGEGPTATQPANDQIGVPAGRYRRIHDSPGARWNGRALQTRHDDEGYNTTGLFVSPTIRTM